STLLLGGCGGTADSDADVEGDLAGTVQADGSSTVYPLTEAVAEEFGLEAGEGARFVLGQPGTGGGFKRFCAGETDLNNASRPISETEKQQCEAAGVDYLELTIALDGLAVLVHPDNAFAACLTVEELRRIWEPSSTVGNWSQVREG